MTQGQAVRVNEEALIEGSGHELGCWEYWIEVAMEDLEAAGHAIEGEALEIHPTTARTMMDQFHHEAATGWQGRRDCHCYTGWLESLTQAENLA